MALSRLITRSAAWLARGAGPPAPPPPPAPDSRTVTWRGAPPPAADPEAVVRAFIADYAAWNDRAWADAAEGAAADERQVDEAYREAVGPHLAPDARPLPACFDGDPLHAPDCETVVDVVVRGELAQVRTRTASRRPGGPHRVFEYRLRRAGERWGIQAVDGLEPDGQAVPTL